MITFTKPENLNGTELRAELNSAGVVISNAPESVAIDENENLVLDINADDEAKAISVVAAHNGTTVAPEPTVADKLASVGLSIEELKTVLGGN
jgi:hypothetical protein